MVVYKFGIRLQASPEFKGIKTYDLEALDHIDSSKPAMNSKGLRQAASRSLAIEDELQASPEFKGIKTDRACSYTRGFLRSKPALNSKGLRPPALRQFISQSRSKPALNSKGLRRWKRERERRRDALQASPEFKGIKTHP